MQVSFIAMIFFSVLGVLVVLYTLHFRHRALAMGSESLLSALSRTVRDEEGEEEDASEEELRQGASQLEARLKMAIYVLFSLLLAVLAFCLVLLATSALPDLSLVLSGICVFLICLLIAAMLLRDIPRNISRVLQEDRNGGRRS